MRCHFKYSNSDSFSSPEPFSLGHSLIRTGLDFKSLHFDPVLGIARTWNPVQSSHPPTPGQTLYKRIPFGCHTEFDNCLCNFLQSKVSCCCTCLWRHHLLEKSENDQDRDSVWFTCFIDIWLLTLLFSFQYLSESCFGNDNTFLLPNPWVVLFFINPTFYSLKILFTQPFTLRCHPRHK
jgi:hypothetical protein